MNLRPWMSRRFFAAALALIVLFTLLLAAVVRLAVNESRLSGDLTEGVVWFSSQAQYEAMRMADASMSFRTGKLSPDELKLRFDIMDSRVHLFEEGQGRRQIDALGFGPQIDQLRLKLDNGRAMLPVLRPDDTAAIDSLHDLAIFTAQTMRDLANTGMLDARERAIERRDERRRILLEVLGFLSATVAAGVMVGIILVRDHRIMTRAEAALERERQVSRLHRAFISVVSHQFRTPLSIIDASAQRMIRRGTAMTHDEIISRAEKIRNACLRLTRLMESTLNAARLEQGEISFRPRACDLPKLIRTIVGSQPEEDQDRIDLSIQSLPIWVTADETLLEQAVQNLLSNALKYSPSGERVLRGRQAAGYRYRDFRHRCGRRHTLRPDRLDLQQFLPRPYRRGHPRHRHRAELCGPDHESAWRPGRCRKRGGTGFDLLPALSLPKAGARGAHCAHGRRSSSRTRTMTATILCVEDEADLRADICEELEAAGYEVNEAGDGLQALASIKEMRPDLVLCDITMPRMSGLQLLTELRGHVELADLPFVFLTALADRSDIIAGKAAGVDDYLTKPIDFDLMLLTIAARLDQVRRVKQAAHLAEPDENAEPRAALMAAREALDHVAAGVFLLNAGRQVIFHNRRAEELLKEADGLTLSHDKLLRGEKPQQTAALREIIDAAIANATADKHTYGNPVGLTRHSGRRSLFAIACPLGHGPAGPGEPVVGLFVTDPEHRSEATAEAVAQLYRLSPAETRLAVALSKGMRIEEIAETFGISRNTVSYTMKNLFRKTETDRQADLISLFIASPVALESE